MYQKCTFVYVCSRCCPPLWVEQRSVWLSLRQRWELLSSMADSVSTFNTKWVYCSYSSAFTLSPSHSKQSQHPLNTLPQAMLRCEKMFKVGLGTQRYLFSVLYSLCNNKNIYFSEKISPKLSISTFWTIGPSNFFLKFFPEILVRFIFFW